VFSPAAVVQHVMELRKRLPPDFSIGGAALRGRRRRARRGGARPRSTWISR
jgi:hypothetical protein